MRADIYPLQMRLLTVSGWVYRHQADVIAYLVEENRFVLSIKSECLDKMIFFGDNSLRRACDDFVEHYHHERAHQGLSNERVERGALMGAGEVECTERLGGILKHSCRAAWERVGRRWITAAIVEMCLWQAVRLIGATPRPKSAS